MSARFTHRIFKILLWILGIVVGLPLLIAVLLYIPPVQNFVVRQACSYVSKSTGMRVSVGHILLKFPLNLKVERATVIEASGDTMALAKNLEVKVALLPLLKGDISLRGLEADSVFYQMNNADSAMWLRANVAYADIGPGNMNFKAGRIDADQAYLRGARVMLAMKDTTTVTPVDTTASSPLTIRAGLVRLEDVDYSMTYPPVIDTLSAHLGSATLRKGLVDIGRRRINASSLKVDGVKAKYLYPAPAESARTAVSTTESVPSDSLWKITADTVSLEAPYALYAMTGAKPIAGMDFNYLEVADTKILLENFMNEGASVGATVKRISTRERCGLTLTADGSFSMDTTAMRARDFNILTNHSRLKLNAEMGMGDLAADPSIPVKLLAKGSLSASDAALAFPALAPTVRALPSPRELNVDVAAAGTMGEIRLKKFSAIFPGVLQLSASGDVRNPMDFNRLGGRMEFEGSVNDPSAVRHTLTALRMDSTIRIPALELKGNVDYNPGDIAGKINLRTSGGQLLADGKWNARREGYQANLKLDDFPVDAFMPSLGVRRVTATVSADGRGYNPLRPSSQIHADVDLASLDYRGRLLKDAVLKADLRQGKAEGFLRSANEDANLDLNFAANLTADSLSGTLNGDIRDLNLYQLGLMEQPCGGSMTLDASGSYIPKNGSFDVTANIGSLAWHMDTLFFLSPEVHLTARSNPSLTYLKLNEESLDATVSIKSSLDSLMPRMDKLLALIDAQVKERKANIAELQSALPPMDAVILSRADNLLTRYLDQTGIGLRDASVMLRNDSLIHFSATAGGVEVGGTPIDSVSFNLNQHGKYLVYSGRMENGPGKLAEWAKVDLRGFLADDKLGVFLDQHNAQGERGYRLGAVASMPSDSIVSLRLAPYDPTIAYKSWELNEDNFLELNLHNLHARANIELSNNSSDIRLFTRATENPTPGSSPEELVVSLKNVQISDWIALSPFAPQMSGLLSGNVVVHTVDKNIVGMADVGLSDFYYDRSRVGDFRVDLNVAENPASRSLTAQGNLWVNGQKTMTINGSLNDSTATNPFLLDFSMIRFPLAVANPFLPKDVVKLRGTLNGTMKVSGKMAAPVFDGFLQFDSAAAKVVMLGTEFTFSDEKIPVDSNTVHFNKFAINTLNENPLLINGDVDISSLSNVGMDLTLAGNDMLVINSNRPKGADVYGKGYMSIDARARGNMRMLMCDANVALLAGSTVTYVLSGGTQELTSQATGDMVKFVNFSDTLSTPVDSVAPPMALILNASLNIQNNTTINVDLNANGTNRVSIMGNGLLNYSMSPQNDGRLTGRFTIDEGFVRYSMAVISEKNFKFDPGSWVNFTGDMMNPSFNITARDKVKANVIPEDGGNTRLVDFDVIVTASGSLENMKVAFNLECNEDITIQNQLASMSADQRANQAMNLLLYNRYTGPGTKADASLGGNPLYSFLASQLNSFAANYVKGVDLSFGIDQYDRTRNGTSGTATSYSYQLSKSLLNNRIRIVVGGQYDTDSENDESIAENLVNDISFEYLLNRSGSMYIRVFRHTSYENILEGEITATGVGFVYKRNLNSLRDMFRFRKKKDIAAPPVLPAPPTPGSKEAVEPSDSTTTKYK